MQLSATISKHRTFLMGLAILAIILFHQNFEGRILWVFKKFGFLGVDIFQFVSGFGCFFALQKYRSLRTFYQRRIARLLPLCILVGVSILIIDLHFKCDINERAFFIDRVFSLHRWYIPLILTCYALAPGFHWLLERFSVKALNVSVAICILLSLLLPITGVWYWPWIFIRMPAFIMGMYIAMFNPTYNKADYIKQYILIILSLIGILTIRELPIRNLFNLTVIPLAYGLPVLCASLAELESHFSKLHLKSFVWICGGCSLEIYLIHEYILSVLGQIDFNSYIKFLIFILVLPTTVYIIRKSIKFFEAMNNYVLGIFSN